MSPRIQSEFLERRKRYRLEMEAATCIYQPSSGSLKLKLKLETHVTRDYNAIIQNQKRSVHLSNVPPLCAK